MKKKIVCMLLCAAMGLSVTACAGSSKETASGSAAAESTESESADTSGTAAESTVSESAAASEAAAAEIDESQYDIPLLDKEDYSTEECITLGEYKNLALTKTVKEVTEGQILLKIINQTGLAVEELKDPKAKVQEGDTAVIEYEGKKDGVAFAGGTSTEPYELSIGSGTFIDGFEDGIIGMKAGETKDLNLTFPENYGSAELAGQDVVFTVTVNSIKRANITDEWVKENAGTDFENAEAYLDSFRKVLEEENSVTAENALKDTAWNTVLDNSTFLALPKKLIADAEAAYTAQAEQMAANYNTTLDAVIEAYGKDKYEAEKAAYAKTNVKNKLLCQALMAAEDISQDGDEYQKALDELVSEVGAASADELISSYGEEYVKELVLDTMAIEKILSYATITEE